MSTTTVQPPPSASPTQESAPSGKWRRWWPFTRHYLEMVVTMAIGMAVLHPLWQLAWPGGLEHDTVMALVMATDMSIGMGAWMRYRGHDWRSTLEMCAVMYAPFAVFFPALWAGGVSGDTMIVAGHSLMLPAMLALMLWRRDDYLRHCAHS